MPIVMEPPPRTVPSAISLTAQHCPRRKLTQPPDLAVPGLLLPEGGQEVASTSRSDLDDLDGGPAEQCEVLGVGGEGGDGSGRGAGDGGEDGVGRVLVAVEAVVAKQRGGLVGDLPGDVVDVDA